MKKTRPNSPAYPCENPNSPFDNNLNGLTKREYFATSRPCIEKSAYDEVVKELHDLKAKMRELEVKADNCEMDNTNMRTIIRTWGINAGLLVDLRKP